VVIDGGNGSNHAMTPFSPDIVSESTENLTADERPRDASLKSVENFPTFAML
jgi:hypothetical protein